MKISLRPQVASPQTLKPQAGIKAKDTTQVPSTSAPNKRTLQQDLIDKFEKALGARRSPFFVEKYRTLPPDIKLKIAQLDQAIAEGKIAPELKKRLGNDPKALQEFRESLIDGLIKACHDPDRIVQGGNPSCAAATAERMLMYKSPKEYLRLTTELITKGETTTLHGRRLVLSPQVADKVMSSVRYEDGRLVSSSLLQSAFLYSFGTRYLEKGLTSDQQRQLLNQVLPGKRKTLYNLERLKTYKEHLASLQKTKAHLKKLRELLNKETDPTKRKEIEKSIKFDEDYIKQEETLLNRLYKYGITKEHLLKLLKSGKRFCAGLLPSGNKVGHAIIVDGIRGNTVLIEDPNFPGQPVEMSLEEFLEKLDYVQKPIK